MYPNISQSYGIIQQTNSRFSLSPVIFEIGNQLNWIYWWTYCIVELVRRGLPLSGFQWGWRLMLLLCCFCLIPTPIAGVGPGRMWQQNCSMWSRELWRSLGKAANPWKKWRIFNGKPMGEWFFVMFNDFYWVLMTLKWWIFIDFRLPRLIFGGVLWNSHCIALGRTA